ncbi:uncharacterized protein HI_0077-like [Ylistrum balloti]|uniref:uncharacterized protein HI_0077-like n=1 Tax=Ylistrum balloti TaxID=509963 RepID=UPI0029059AD8|nr:uncharacterized protein HI_0077-like [Ylistrum balloti]XP_060083877.1 uncharacterized protein HI_0077-like [Ylistrum balloti]XP_060083878.1 uncharacterized protein HI_0077-like [Ylistrum balloti]
MESGFEKDLVDALKSVVKGSNWQCLGDVDQLKTLKCRRVYTDEGDDLVLINVQNGKQFFVLDASCPHEGGPLDEGDIEDIDGRWVVLCPWHFYDYDLETGKSSSGLVQDTYPVEVVDGKVYINTDRNLSLHPIKTKQLTTDPGVTTDSITVKEDDNSLTYWAVKILQTSNPEEKARLTLEIGELWRSGKITGIGNNSPPDQPSRDPQLSIVAPGKENKRGKGATQSSRIANLHSLANIEQWAIDLSWDIVARFPCWPSDVVTDHTTDVLQLPKAFFDDFIQVACDEAKHFLLLSNRLKDLNSHFGALTVHNGLWESATETRDSLLARLAIVHMVHEARGLDVQPKTLAKFATQKDVKSVDVLKVIYTDEITHVAAGLRWFTYVCQHHSPPLECIPTFHDMVKKHFRGYLKPPFNTEGRDTAGMGPEWYMPLIKPQS